LETGAHAALGSHPAETPHAPLRNNNFPNGQNGGMNISGGPEQEQYDPPGAHFAPSPDKNTGLPGDGRSKHGSDDSTQPDSEFLRMFPGARG
jgi:hypothetical protein